MLKWKIIHRSKDVQRCEEEKCSVVECGLKPDVANFGIMASLWCRYDQFIMWSQCLVITFKSRWISIAVQIFVPALSKRSTAWNVARKFLRYHTRLRRNICSILQQWRWVEQWCCASAVIIETHKWQQSAHAVVMHSDVVTSLWKLISSWHQSRLVLPSEVWKKSIVLNDVTHAASLGCYSYLTPIHRYDPFISYQLHQFALSITSFIYWVSLINLI